MPRLTSLKPRIPAARLSSLSPAPDDSQRPSASARGYDWKWQKARAAFLAEHPLCVACKAEGRITQATVVDHIIPHRGDERLFWDRSNWQPLCKAHHDAKTAREDGGFGNPEA